MCAAKPNFQSHTLADIITTLPVGCSFALTCHSLGKLHDIRKELREEGKLLWSGGQRQKKRRTTQQRKKVPRANDREGTDDSDTFRLIVTDDGNAILEREGSEVVWKALDR